MTNSDADLLRRFVDFLRTWHGVRNQSMTLSVNCYLGNGVSLADIETWWLGRLDLPRSSARSHTVNDPRVRDFRRTRLPYGTARVVVHSTFIVQSIYGAIQEYAGIDRPEWLD